MPLEPKIKVSPLYDEQIDAYGNPKPVVMGRGHFYKYKSLAPKYLPHTLEIIKDRKIFCPRPSQTNDKDEEFKPPVTVGDYSDPIYRARVHRWVRRIATRSNPHALEAQIQHQLSIITQEGLESYAKQLEPEYHQEIENQDRLLSLSDIPDNHHLWVNYADDYAGISFQFFITPEFSTVYQVNYVQSRPKWDLVCDQDMETLSATALTKLDKWRDEREFRVVISEPPLPYGPVLVNQKLDLPIEAFAGIYLGNKINPTIKTLIVDLAKQYLPLVPIYEVAKGSLIKKIL